MRLELITINSWDWRSTTWAINPLNLRDYIQSKFIYDDLKVYSIKKLKSNGLDIIILIIKYKPFLFAKCFFLNSLRKKRFQLKTLILFSKLVSKEESRNGKSLFLTYQRYIRNNDLPFTLKTQKETAYILYLKI